MQRIFQIEEGIMTTLTERERFQRAAQTISEEPKIGFNIHRPNSPDSQTETLYFELRKILKRFLTRREAAIFRNAHGLNKRGVQHTLTKISRMFGLSEDEAGDIYEQAVTKLQQNEEVQELLQSFKVTS